MFQGAYSDAPKWCEAMQGVETSRGRRVETLYYFYTTCPRCAKHYGTNYVVGVAKLT